MKLCNLLDVSTGLILPEAVHLHHGAGFLPKSRTIVWAEECLNFSYTQYTSQAKGHKTRQSIECCYSSRHPARVDLHPAKSPTHKAGKAIAVEVIGCGHGLKWTRHRLRQQMGGRIALPGRAMLEIPPVT